MDSIPLEFHTPTPSEVVDFGRVFQHPPSLVLKPNRPEDISLLLKHISSSPCYNNITVAARGAGHSVHGQAQALDGIVIDMTSLPTSIKIGKENERFFVDVGGGVQWIEVLKETLKHGLTPRTWTDYLFLSVGGTLSVGGIGGQTFKYGPQICNVLEMDVITGRRDFITCTKERNSDLFHAVLGGLGQFGIIIRARVILDYAPKMVKRTTISYDDFHTFSRDQERLLTMEAVDYLEGFIKPCYCESSDHSEFSHRGGTKKVYYVIEMATYYNDGEDIEQTLETILSELSSLRSSVHTIDISYFDFLNQVGFEEQNLLSQGLWEVPHPWLNIFVPRSKINTCTDLVLKTISATPAIGPILFYPIRRHKWNPRMFAVIPKTDAVQDIFYVVGLLRSAIPSTCLEMLLDQNQRIIDAITSRNISVHFDNSITRTDNGVGVNDKNVDLFEGQGGLGGKQYMPCCRDESEWRVHFGEEWERLESLKSKFDPLHILAPGQKIFKRINMEKISNPKINSGCSCIQE